MDSARAVTKNDGASPVVSAKPKPTKLFSSRNKVAPAPSELVTTIRASTTNESGHSISSAMSVTPLDMNAFEDQKTAPTAPDEGVGDAEIAHDEHAHSASASARSAKAKVFPMPVDEALSENGIDADAGDASTSDPPSANMGPTSRKVAPAPYHDDNELTDSY